MLVQQLLSGSLPEQHQAVAALSELPLTPRNWLSAVGAIPRLVQLMHSNPPGVPQTQAARHLLQLISDYEGGGSGCAAPSGIVPPLVPLLHHADGFVCHVAAMTLSNLAMNADNKPKIMEAGAIAPLVQMLKSRFPGHHYTAARALAGLAEDRNVRTHIIAAGAIGPLLRLFSADRPEVQHTAVMAVRIICCRNAEPVAAAGAIPLFVKLLKSSSDVDVQVEAAQALGLLAQNANVIAQVAVAGAIPLLVGLLRTSTSTGSSATVLKLEAARALGILAFKAQSETIAAGAIEPLASLLKSDSEEMQLAASYALFGLSSENGAAQARIAAAGVIAPLVRLLRAASSSVELRQNAVTTLANLASHDVRPVVAAGAIPPLVKPLSDSSTEMHKLSACSALQTIAKDSDTHAAILAAAPILPLVRLMTSSSEDTQESAQNTLLCLSTTPTFPQLFLDAGAIPPLVQMLRSGSALGQERAMQLLGRLLAVKERADMIFVPLKNAGALPLLARIQTAASSSEFMRFGAERLLLALATGESPFGDPEAIPPSAPSPPVASVHPASAAASPSTAAAAFPPAATSPQQQQQLPPPRPRKSCWSCGVTGVLLKKCSVCAVAAYCGAGCQKTDWKAHKGQCAGLKAGATGSGSGAAGEK